MSLPLLLCVLALIINFGNAATWKVRAATANRLVAWRARPGFGVSGDPAPQNLVPAQNTLSFQGANRIAQVDTYWNIPAIQQDFLQGSAANGGGSGIIRINDREQLDMSQGVAQGHVDLTQRFPFMPSAGNIHYSLDHPLVDGNWQFNDMGYAYNHSRRTAGWYRWSDAPEWAAQRQRFLQADSQIRNNPQRELLRPLDRDEELINGGYSFDFYPRMQVVCSNNPREVLQQHIMNRGGLVDRIQGHPAPQKVVGLVERMAQTYRRMYQDELDLLEAQPNPPAGRIAILQQLIAQLDALIRQIP